MALTEQPWEDLHHRSSFLPNQERVEKQIQVLTSTHIVDTPSVSPNSQPTSSKGNLGNISKTISIDISVNIGVIEHIQIGVECSPKEIKIYTALFKELCDVFAWYYEEMTRINPQSVAHEIQTYPRSLLIWQWLCLVYP